MSVIQLPLFTEAEAREHTERTRESLTQSWQLIVEGYQRDVHRALGYASWRDYAVTEFAVSQAHAYRLLNHGQVMHALDAISPIGEKPSEAQARELAPLKDEPEAVADAWAETVERTNGQPTAADVRDVVKERKPPKPKQEPQPAAPLDVEPEPDAAATPEIVYTAHVGDNADLIAAAASLYIQDGATVADVTYGKGAFWTKTDHARFTLLRSDVEPAGPGINQADFCTLPHDDESLHVVVLDPPYVHNPGAKDKRHATDARYNNAATTAGMYNADIMQLYEHGMTEALRVLRADGGQLWVKCKDEIEAGVQRWSHIAIYEIARDLGLWARDLFVLLPTSRTTSNRWRRQIHARKNHSYLWIFERPDDAYRKLLERRPPSRTQS